MENYQSQIYLFISDKEVLMGGSIENLTLTAIEILIDRLQPANIVMCMRNKMNIEHIRFSKITTLKTEFQSSYEFDHEKVGISRNLKRNNFAKHLVNYEQLRALVWDGGSEIVIMQERRLQQKDYKK